MRRYVALLLLCLGSYSNFAYAKGVVYKKIENIFQLPVRNRIAVFRSQPNFYFHHLKLMFYAKGSSDEIKWKSLISMARLHPKKAQSHIQQAAQNGNWFLKNAALIAMETIDSSQALAWAEQFLNHSSLVLRTASVELIRRQKAIQYKNILWQKLKDKKNFRNGKSLWIRYTILQTLSEFSQIVDVPRFKGLLQEKDPRIISIAQRVLSRLAPYEYLKREKQMIGRSSPKSIEL